LVEFGYILKKLCATFGDEKISCCNIRISWASVAVIFRTEEFKEVCRYGWMGSYLTIGRGAFSYMLEIKGSVYVTIYPIHINLVLPCNIPICVTGHRSGGTGWTPLWVNNLTKSRPTHLSGSPSKIILGKGVEQAPYNNPDLDNNYATPGNLDIHSLMILSHENTL
jgi:hypothetical protein